MDIRNLRDNRMSRSVKRRPSIRQKKTKIGMTGMDIRKNRLGTKRQRDMMTKRLEIGGEMTNNRKK